MREEGAVVAKSETCRTRARGPLQLLLGGCLNVTSSVTSVVTSSVLSVATSVATLAGAPARASEPPSPEEARAAAKAAQEAVLAERDQLIERIAQGVDLEQSVRRFKELFQQRQAQRDADKRAAEARAEQQREAARDSLTLDYRVAHQCVLSADPAAPPQRVIWELFRGDYGKVVRKETIEIPPRNAFLKPKTVHVYQIEGRQHRYVISSESPRTFDHQPLQASVGDLVLVCRAGMSTHGSGHPFPADLRDNIVESGFVARLKAPPRLADKDLQRLNPVHLLGTARLRMAIERTEWPLPPEQPVLTRLRVERDLGSGRFELQVEPQHGSRAPVTLYLDVPASVPRRKLVEPGRMLWFVVRSPRFDADLKKLVLRAEVVEDRLLDPLPTPPAPSPAP
jgi:hypothetical protein